MSPRIIRDSSLVARRSVFVFSIVWFLTWLYLISSNPVCSMSCATSSNLSGLRGTIARRRLGNCCFKLR